jgi:phosphoadenosine phosphosulfate reductase
MIAKENIPLVKQKVNGLSPEETIRYFLECCKGKIAFATSLGAEDQVITDLLIKTDPSIRIFTLDTGRLFNETLELLQLTNLKYSINIEVYFPDYQKVEKMVADHGINLFYSSVENRKHCCHIRKVEPLKRALKDVDVWITGIRREQSITRKDNDLVEWDDEYQLVKVCPLLDWTEAQVWDYIKKNNVPYNPLHDKGYPSIGCIPCTRAVEQGEELRDGRWWWESAENKECGLHFKSRE